MVPRPLVLFSDPIHGPVATCVTAIRDWPAWRRGRRRYGVWIVPVHAPVLLAHIRAARAELADLLHPQRRRAPHLTVFVCGFVRRVEQWDDDFPPGRLAVQTRNLEALSPRACRLPVGAADSFASAAFLPVGDPEGRLARWRAALGIASPEIRQQPYHAHITLGLYRRRVDAAMVRERLARIPPAPVALTVDALEFATYDARCQCGALASLYRLPLAGAPPVHRGAGL